MQILIGETGAFANGVYLTIFGGVCVLIVAGVLLLYKRWTLQRLFPIVAVMLGVLYMYALPTFSVPDEMSHFNAAYALSGQMLGQEDNEIWIMLNMRRCDQAYHDTTLTADSYDKFAATFSGDVDERMQYVLNYNTHCKTAAFVPAIGISIARLLHLNFGWVSLLGRCCQLALYIATVTYALTILPKGKRILFVVALLPITMQQACSFSYDCELLAAAFVTIALSMHWWTDGLPPMKKTPRLVEYVLYLIAAVYLCTIKNGVYAVLLLLPIVLMAGTWWRGAERHQKRTMLGAVAGMLLVAVLLFFVFDGMGRLRYLLGQNFYIEYCDAYAASGLQRFLRPKESLLILLRTVKEKGGFYLVSMVGGLLSNLDIVIPRGVYYPIAVCLLVAMVRTRDEQPEISGEKQLTMANRVSILVVATISILLVMLAMWVTWTPWYAQVIEGVQGRYFLPLLPVLCLALGNWKKPCIPCNRITLERVIVFAIISLNILTIFSIYIAVGRR